MVDQSWQLLLGILKLKLNKTHVITFDSYNNNEQVEDGNICINMWVKSLQRTADCTLEFKITLEGVRATRFSLNQVEQINLETRSGSSKLVSQRDLTFDQRTSVTKEQ